MENQSCGHRGRIETVPPRAGTRRSHQRAGGGAVRGRSPAVVLWVETGSEKISESGGEIGFFGYLQCARRKNAVEKKIDKEEPEHEQCDSQEKPVGDKKIAEPEISGSGKTKPASLEQKRFWRDWTSLEKTGVIFNGMLVLFTVIYAFVSLWQASIAQQGASAAQIS